MLFILSLLAATLLMTGGSIAAAGDARSGLTPDMVSTFTLRQIRFELKRRHLTCDDCVERDHFLKFLLDHLDAPVDNSVLLMDGASPSSTKRRPERKVAPDDASSLEPEGEQPKRSEPSEEEIEGLYESIMKKKKEEDQLKETLRKAGLDPTKLKGGFGSGWGDGFGGGSFDKWAKEYEKKRRKTDKKKSTGEEKKPAAKKAAAADDDGVISDEM